jgi:hypothetical protein
VTTLVFACTEVAAERYGAGPTLLFRLRVSESSGHQVHAIALRVQIRIEPARRHYSDREAELLSDVFGERSRWGETLRPMQFAHATVMVPSFEGSVDVEVPVPVSYDLEVATGKLLHAVDGDPVAMTLLFSGTVFGRSDRGFWVERVPWHCEASASLPAGLWRQLMDEYFPDAGWLRLHRSTLDALARYKAQHALATWDDTLTALLGAEVAP